MQCSAAIGMKTRRLTTLCCTLRAYQQKNWEVIDPALLAVAHNAVQLPTPRASVTPNLSPFKLRSDTSSIAALSPLNVAADNAHPVGATAEPDKGEQSELREGTAAEAIPTAEGRKPSTKPPKPRPKGKAAVVLGRQKDVPPGTPAGRKSADALAVAEASKLGLPATRGGGRESLIHSSHLSTKIYFLGTPNLPGRTSTLCTYKKMWAAFKLAPEDGHSAIHIQVMWPRLFALRHPRGRAPAAAVGRWLGT